MNFIKTSLLPRWQLLVFTIFNIPSFIGVTIYGYIIWVTINEPNSGGLTLLGYGLALAIIAPYMITFTLVSIPFILWYLWKLGGKSPSSPTKGDKRMREKLILYIFIISASILFWTSSYIQNISLLIFTTSLPLLYSVIMSFVSYTQGRKEEP